MISISNKVLERIVDIGAHLSESIVRLELEVCVLPFCRKVESGVGDISGLGFSSFLRRFQCYNSC